MGTYMDHYFDTQFEEVIFRGDPSHIEDAARKELGIPMLGSTPGNLHQFQPSVGSGETSDESREVS
jgi:hypothetical protein